MRACVQGTRLENNGLQGNWQLPAPVTCGRVCGRCNGVLLAERVGTTCSSVARSKVLRPCVLLLAMVSPFSAIARASCNETGRSSTAKLSPPEVLGSPSEKRISWNHEIADIRWSSTAASPLQNRVESSSPFLNCASKESGSAVRRSLIATHVPYHVLSELVVPILCFLDHIVAI